MQPIDAALFQENERTSPSLDERRYFNCGTVVCESGDNLDEVQIAYETWGELSSRHDNAILICHALSGDSHAIGWWDRLIGQGKAIDTDRYFVIGSNVLGGCQGSTGPSSLTPDGVPYGSKFPKITVGDMVDCQKQLIGHLGITELVAVAGGSMGGMQALEWTTRHPGSVRKAFITASCRAHSGMQIALNAVGREAIMRDPNWRSGDYDLDSGPSAGLAIARMIGHISFLSEAAFEGKFSRRLRPDGDFEVEGYLRHQAEKFNTRFDANSFLVLSQAIDRYNCSSLKGSASQYLFTSFTSDWLYPPHQSAEMHRMATEAGHDSQHVVIDLPNGHDSFLLDGVHQGALLARFLAK